MLLYYTAEYIEEKYENYKNYQDKHLERLFIMTKSMKNSYKLFGQLIQIDVFLIINYYFTI